MINLAWAFSAEDGRHFGVLPVDNDTAFDLMFSCVRTEGRLEITLYGWLTL